MFFFLKERHMLELLKQNVRKTETVEAHRHWPIQLPWELLWEIVRKKKIHMENVNLLTQAAWDPLLIRHRPPVSQEHHPVKVLQVNFLSRFNSFVRFIFSLYLRICSVKMALQFSSFQFRKTHFQLAFHFCHTLVHSTTNFSRKKKRLQLFNLFV